MPPLAPFVIARLRRSRGNPQTTIFLFIHRKEKEITIIYQIKELILNKILIFNFDLTLFILYFVGRQAKMIKQAYNFPTLCFNFQFLMY